MSGPLQLIAIGFPAGWQPDRVIDEIDKVEAKGGIRILDMLLVAKDQYDSVTPLSFGQDEDEGVLISQLVPVDRARVSGGAAAKLWAQIQALPAQTLVAYLLVEHMWADGILQTIEAEGGSMLGTGFLSPELALGISGELAALEDAGRTVDAALANETVAQLTAIAAMAETDQVIASSARLQAQATTEALRVITLAGLAESTAIHEALDVLNAAGLIIARADEIVADALTTDAYLVAAIDQATDTAIADDRAAIAASEHKVTNAAIAASITPAETRVLRYLSTKLTFALIADKLELSRGAAKMRAERAYQKLGVHTRAGAVARARALRVIP